MKRNKLFDEIVARIPKETMERVRKQMTCRWYYNGGDCGLPGVASGTPCMPDGCDSWECWKKENDV